MYNKKIQLDKVLQNILWYAYIIVTHELFLKTYICNQHQYEDSRVYQALLIYMHIDTQQSLLLA